jgi:mono/diheme cytochrome c family protein
MLPRPARLASAGLAFLVPALVLLTTTAALAASETAALPGDPVNGKAVYDANCVACHGASLQGGIGRRLSPIQKGHDNADFIIGTVTNGVKGTQMPAWGAANGGALDSRQIDDVASYVLSRQSSPATLDAGALARSTILWVSAGVIAMLALTFLLSRYNMRWIGRRAAERRQP